MVHTCSMTILYTRSMIVIHLYVLPCAAMWSTRCHQRMAALSAHITLTKHMNICRRVGLAARSLSTCHVARHWRSIIEELVHLSISVLIIVANCFGKIYTWTDAATGAGFVHTATAISTTSIRHSQWKPTSMSNLCLDRSPSHLVPLQRAVLRLTKYRSITRPCWRSMPEVRSSHLVYQVLLWLWAQDFELVQDVTSTCRCAKWQQQCSDRRNPSCNRPVERSIGWAHRWYCRRFALLKCNGCVFKFARV